MSTTHMKMPIGRTLDLPPPFRLISLREGGDAFAHATAIAAAEGAGALVHVGRFDLAEFAVVLEPSEVLRSARWAFYAGLVALGDALAGFAPAKKPIQFDWPGTIRVDGGFVGGARLGWPLGADEDKVPEWLVFGAMIRTISLGSSEPGLRALNTALEEEGFDDLGSGRLLETFSRHLMAIFDLASEQGVGAVTARFLDRLNPVAATCFVIDTNGDFLVQSQRTGQQFERRSLSAAIAMPEWLNLMSGGSRR